MAQRYFYFDQTKCMGCQTCVVACKDFKELKPGRAKPRNMYDKEVGTWPNSDVKFAVYGCMHCADPACIPACPMGAIYKDDKYGQVMIDSARCGGVGACKLACPYSSPQFLDDNQEEDKLPHATATGSHRAMKCDMCVERLDKGQMPVCVDSCLTRALDFGTKEDIMRRHPGVMYLGTLDMDGFEDNPNASVSRQDTGPAFFFTPKAK